MTIIARTISRLLPALLLSACAAGSPELGYQLIESYAHDRSLFTQGLAYRDGLLYESGGLRGQSRLLLRRLETLAPLREQALPADIFAEGLTVLGDRLYLLSWTSGRGFIYHADTLAPIAQFAIDGEGWGLCTNGRELIMSDGSATLRVLDAQTLSVLRRIEVRENGQPLTRLNELEWIDGYIYANIWQRDRIVIIDPHSGTVIAQLSLAGLLPAHLRTADTDVLNGIAYDAARGQLLITGKRWPRLYRLALRQVPGTERSRLPAQP